MAVQDQNLEKQIQKQMGCMASFLQIFDHHQLLTGKCLYSPKRLPSSAVLVSLPDTESSKSLEISKELEKPQQYKTAMSPDRSKLSPPHTTKIQSPAPESNLKFLLPVFEFKEGTRSSWKFSREAPRLSLDSRATVDTKGSLYSR